MENSLMTYMRKKGPSWITAAGVRMTEGASTQSRNPFLVDRKGRLPRTGMLGGPGNDFWRLLKLFMGHWKKNSYRVLFFCILHMIDFRHCTSRPSWPHHSSLVIICQIKKSSHYLLTPFMHYFFKWLTLTSRKLRGSKLLWEDRPAFCVHFNCNVLYSSLVGLNTIYNSYLQFTPESEYWERKW